MIKYLPYSENLLKIDPVDAADSFAQRIILKNKLIRNKLAQAKHIACGEDMQHRLNEWSSYGHVVCFSTKCIRVLL